MFIYAPMHHFPCALILLGMSVTIRPLMSTHVLSLPNVMTTEHLSLQHFAHGLYRVTGSIWDGLMRKCFVLSYTQWH